MKEITATQQAERLYSFCTDRNLKYGIIDVESKNEKKIIIELFKILDLAFINELKKRHIAVFLYKRKYYDMLIEFLKEQTKLNFYNRKNSIASCQNFTSEKFILEQIEILKKHIEKEIYKK